MLKSQIFSQQPYFKKRPHGLKFHFVTFLMLVGYTLVVAFVVKFGTADLRKLAWSYSGQTTGVITSESESINAGSAKWLPNIHQYSYKYNVAGKVYQSNDYSALYQRFKEGQQFIVLYMPDRPSQAKPAIALRDQIIDFGLLAAAIGFAIAVLAFLLMRMTYESKVASNILAVLVLAFGSLSFILFYFSVMVAEVVLPILFAVIAASIFGYSYYLDKKQR